MSFDISSLQNPRIKHLVRLREDKRQRQADGLMLVEGWDELSLALGSGMRPQAVFTAPELVTRPIEDVPGEIITLDRLVFKKLSYRDTPDGWLGVFPIPHRSFDSLQLGPSPLLIVAESVEKPGNLGAILRTADAAGVDAVLVCDPRVDLWNPNVVRASRGALFTVPAIEVDNRTALDWLKANRIQILAATPASTTSYLSADMTGGTAIAVGTEDAGLSDFWMSSADLQVLIPMTGKVNSLNVSISTALIVYEALRQRGR